MDFVRALNGVQQALRVRLTPWLEREYGIDLKLFMLLRLIQLGSTHPGALAQGTMEAPSQISRRLDKLAQRGLIERSLDPGDSRRIRLQTTPAAKALFDAVEQAFAAEVGPVLGAIAPDRRAAMVAGLKEIGAALGPAQP